MTPIGTPTARPNRVADTSKGAVDTSEGVEYNRDGGSGAGGKGTGGSCGCGGGGDGDGGGGGVGGGDVGGGA